MRFTMSASLPHDLKPNERCERSMFRIVWSHAARAMAGDAGFSNDEAASQPVFRLPLPDEIDPCIPCVPTTGDTSMVGLTRQ
jgi:hypothetical protein